MVGKTAPARARDALVALGIALALLLVAGFTVLALAYAVKSGIDGKWTDAYDAAKRGGEGVIGLAVVVYVWMRYGLVAVHRIWFSTAELARDRAVEEAARAVAAGRSREEVDAAAARTLDAERVLRERFPDDPSLTAERPGPRP